ncbi:MAG: enhanced serine sensitivity protein SseB [Oscillospiraceae bacterium]|nr:enhanced serine sensitivity protein SseB [Oscillospiraceae bacterium]MBR2912692.1 enhanced serine sensitivity protein SseB [Oscillospiraceae bacterium]MBR4101661.1 enhanced serine sensitivity protein SseB [Oscillospiraceae bacterium]MBR6617446.1 enhanced serine sensitivity protein SseB [Oscillospiraceae bacterium]
MNLDELLKAAINDPTKRSAFLQTLIRSDIYVICKNPVKHGDNNEGVQMELITIQNPEGDLFIPFFTSYRALQQFAKRYVECYKLNCLRFFDLIQNVSAVLNPNSYGKEFSSPEIKSILMIARNLHIKAISYNEAETISYRVPQRSVSHITRAANKFFAKQPNVDRAFVLEMTRGSEKPQVLIIVDMIGNTRKLFVPLARHLSQSVKSGDHLCFLSYEQENAKKATEDVAPFYVRKKRFFEK